MQPYNITLKLDVDHALKLFDPKRFDALVEALWGIMHQEMYEVVQVSIQAAPVESGHLQSNIQIIDSDRMGMWILAGTVGVPYALYLEFGTRYMNPKWCWRALVWEGFFRIRDRVEVAVRQWGNV